ncbi:NAD(P)/FAD-dependent oxidoreductase [Ancylobacter polymorphus]|uniref:Gamma-glutamylputrescine oxidase n=1 Tax=Ancylobacter polymorphus TaxID=223390 RepID=A0ABU0BG27_9HYPH|nr:FAD-binding oxidoreductase [Ancylobacter polymorphus]MDQ0304786.1 gamma-glutamylputrescine oxidase [Ancylobacter polymorphus]
MASTLDHPKSWYAATANRFSPLPPLQGGTRADVCVIGGGYTGLSAALHMAEAGLDVVLLEAGRVGSGASGRNGGQIHSGHRRDQDFLEAQVGLDDAKALWRMAEDAKALLHALIKRHAIDCDVRPGLVVADHKPGYVAHSHAYAKKLNEVYDYPDAAPLSREELRAIVGSDVYHGGMIDHGGGHLHPLNLALGLADAARRAGARLYEQSRALRIEEGAKVRVVTAAGSVEADWVLECGDGLQDGLDRRVDTHVMPICNYIAATAPLGERAREIISNGAAVADSRFVVNYYRLSGDGRLLFGGGESYRRGLRPNPAEFVRPYMLRIFPQLADVAIDYGWGGVLGITMTRLPFVRKLSPRVLTAAGYSGQGVMLAPYFGKLLGEAVKGQLGGLDLLGRLPVPAFPGGPLMRWPLLVAGLSYYALRDRL